MTTTMTTRSSTKNLDYAMGDALKQFQAEVAKVCAANERTEKQLHSLVNRLDGTKVGFVLSCMHV